jgi:hypothetical protein
MVSFTSQPLNPRPHWIANWWGHRVDLDAEEEAHLLLVTEIEPRFLGRPARNLDAITTELSRIKIIDINLE